MLSRSSSWLGNLLDNIAERSDRTLTAIGRNLEGIARQVGVIGNLTAGVEALTGARVGANRVYETSEALSGKARDVEMEKQRRITSYEGARSGAARPKAGAQTSAQKAAAARKKKKRNRSAIEDSI